MLKSCRALFFTLLSLGVFAPVIAADPPDAEQLFKQKCSLCHAMDKKKLGPAVTTVRRRACVRLLQRAGTLCPALKEN